MKGDVVVRGSEEGKAYWLLGGLYEVKVAAAETGGAMTMIEATLPAGLGPPPHTHPGAESVYVLEGRIRYHIDGEAFEGAPGSCFHIPAGTVENFEPTEAARLLVIYSPPGTIEEFFAEAGEPAERREVPPAPTEPPDIDRLVAIGEKHGMQLAGPAG